MNPRRRSIHLLLLHDDLNASGDNRALLVSSVLRLMSECVSDAQKSQEWADAMQAEMDSLRDHDVWELVELPEGRKPVGSKWVFKLKTNADGSVERCKARLVAQGYSQKEGLDYDETFSPVVRPESVRSVIACSNLYYMITDYYIMSCDNHVCLYYYKNYVIITSFLSYKSNKQLKQNLNVNNT